MGDGGCNCKWDASGGKCLKTTECGGVGITGITSNPGDNSKDGHDEFTCGHVKMAYKENKCCGNPTNKFHMKDRRLSSMPSNGASNEAVVERVKDALEVALKSG